MSTLQARRPLARNINLPTLPAVMQRLSKVLEDPDAGARDIGLLVAEDPALTAKVLKIADSAYYGLRERCLAPQQAASILGMKVLLNMVTQAAVTKQYDHLHNLALDIDALWRHSILTAHCCQQLGRKCRNSIGLAPDELCICGLLHDLGQVVLLVRHANLFTHAVDEGAADPASVFGADLQQFLGLEPEALAEPVTFAEQAQAGIVL